MFLRQLVPVVVLCFFFASKKITNKFFSTIFVFGSSIVLLFSFPKTEVALLWISYCLVVYIFGCLVFGDHVLAACYAISSAHFGGWLYEIPFWHPTSMFYSFHYPWVINTQILSGVFCVWLLNKREVKANKTMLLAIFGYVSVLWFWVLKLRYRLFRTVPLWWMPRLGVMFLLGSILTGINGEIKK